MQFISIFHWSHMFLSGFLLVGVPSYTAQPSFNLSRSTIDHLRDQFSAHHRRRITTRHWYKIVAVLGIVVSCLVERGSTTHLEKQLADQAKQIANLEVLMQQTSHAINGQHSVLQPALRTMPQYVIQLLSRPIKAAWYGAKYLIFATLAQKFINTLVDQLLDPLGTTATLTAADSWFLHEQVAQSQAMFVVVKEEMTQFIQALNAIEVSIQSVLHVKQQGMVLKDNHLQDIIHQGEQVLAHVEALHLLTAKDQYTASYTMMNTLGQDYTICLEHFCADMYATYHGRSKEDIAAICSRVIQNLRHLIRPLRSLSIYQVLPWPFSIALQESLHRMIALYYTYTINPLHH